MKQLHRCLTFALFLTLLLAVRGSISIAAAPLFSVSDSMTIYYQLDENDENCSGATTLGEYVKHTLPFEWPAESVVMERPGGIQALKAGAVAIRTNAVSAYHTKEVNKGGTKYLCAIYGRQNHKPNDSIDSFPNAQQAVIGTNGIILTHPDATDWENSHGRTIHTGAIDAQYRDDTGQYTAWGPYPWLESVYDPISAGTPKEGMGQHGSKRWAWGLSESGEKFPKWDYRRILVHYYTGIDFAGLSPHPHEGFRNNMLKIEGVDPHIGLSLRKGEERTGIRILFQNTGQWDWPADPGDLNGTCLQPGPANYQTKLGHHLYRQDGTLACTNCVDIRSTPLCRPVSTLGPGLTHWFNGFRIFVRDDPAIIVGQTYLLRFDVGHYYPEGIWWEGYSTSPPFTWPSQDIQVTIEAPPGGGGTPAVQFDPPPPAVIDYDDLEVDEDNPTGPRLFVLHWIGINGADRFDLRYRNKDITDLSYPSTFTTLLQNDYQQVLEYPLPCDYDRRDWQFQVQGWYSIQPTGWVLAETRSQVYPRPWLSYQTISAMKLDSDPGPWPRPASVINLGGGSFNWTANSSDSWIIVNNAGQGEGSLGVVLYKPGGEGDYPGTITVNITNPTPSHFCGENDQPTSSIQFEIPVTLTIRAVFELQYLPLILKSSQ